LKGMYLHTASYCLVECAPQWMEFIGQLSLFGVRKDKYKTVASCQDYCITVPSCVAVDFKLLDNSCWLHDSPDHLSKATTIPHDGTNQYRLDRPCPTTASS